MTLDIREEYANATVAFLAGEISFTIERAALLPLTPFQKDSVPCPFVYCENTVKGFVAVRDGIEIDHWKATCPNCGTAVVLAE